MISLVILADMIVEGIPLTAILTPIGITGLLVFLFFLFSTGKAATPQQVKDYKEEITYLRKALDEERAQKLILIREQSNVVQLMSAFRHLAEKLGDER